MRPPGRHRRLARASLLGLVAVAVAGCYPASPAPVGQEIRRLYDIFFAGGAIVVALIWLLVAWVVIRYRRRDDRLPRQTSGSLALEISWVVLPLIVVVGLFVLTVQTMSTIQAGTSGSGVNVHVWAFRWQWRFDYPDRNVSVVGTPDSEPELVVPVGTPIRVTLDALDVNHSFYVPAFLFKRDAIPGLRNQFEFSVDTPGTYRGFCAEYCGVLHAEMTFRVRAVTPAEFESWVAAQPPALPTPAGLVGPAPSGGAQ